uniref:Peptide ABC transporter permease n=1 Tax=Chryseobacterium sp. B5 TaxID=2050562 RepID=A0A2G7T6M4_9FLAO
MCCTRCLIRACAIPWRTGHEHCRLKRSFPGPGCPGRARHSYSHGAASVVPGPCASRPAPRLRLAGPPAIPETPAAHAGPGLAGDCRGRRCGRWRPAGSPTRTRSRARPPAVAGAPAPRTGWARTRWGRDLWGARVHGAVHSLSGAFVAVGVGLAVGTLIGLLAGATGGRTEDALMRLVDVLLAVPSLLLSLTIIIVLGFGTINAAIAVGVVSVASFARLVRSEVVRVRRSDYVEAAFGSGGRFAAVLWRHVLPNSLTSVIAMAALQFGSAILAISTLGFLGYGAPPPTPEWGAADRRRPQLHRHRLVADHGAGLIVVAVVLAANRIATAFARRPA